MNTGKQIKIIREAKNITKDQMADWLNLSLNTYKKIEYGERIPNLEEIKLISEKLEIDPTFFLSSNSNSIFNSGNQSPGVGIGNVISIDREFLDAITKAINSMSESIVLLTNHLKK